MANRPRVVIIGAGIVGCSAAFFLSQKGYEVIVIEQGPRVAASASGLNAGLVSLDPPGSFYHYLSHGSLQLYHELQHRHQLDIELQPTNTLYAIHTPQQLKLAEKMVQENPSLRIIPQSGVHEKEPLASSDLLGFLEYPGGANADPVKATTAFATLASKHGAVFHTSTRVTQIRVEAEKYLLTLQCCQGTNDECVVKELDTSILLVCAGWQTNLLLSPLGISLPVFPVKGQMWACQPPGNTMVVYNNIQSMESIECWRHRPTLLDLTHTQPQGTRATRHLYGRQRRNGEIVFGGDRVGFEPHPQLTGEPNGVGIHENREHASQVLPFLSHLPISRTWHGFMPWTLDRKPIIGRIQLPGMHSQAQASQLYVATGLCSAGFMRGPKTGELIARCVEAGGHQPLYQQVPQLRDADPARFTRIASKL